MYVLWWLTISNPSCHVVWHGMTSSWWWHGMMSSRCHPIGIILERSFHVAMMLISYQNLMDTRDHLPSAVDLTIIFGFGGVVYSCPDVRYSSYIHRPYSWLDSFDVALYNKGWCQRHRVPRWSSFFDTLQEMDTICPWVMVHNLSSEMNEKRKSKGGSLLWCIEMQILPVSRPMSAIRSRFRMICYV